MKKQSGFTLIELAIVLVIIGLLLGGVLRGQELINSAKVKNIARDFQNAQVYLYGYQDKYKALPGDDRAAVVHLGVLASQATGSQGNGQIDGVWDVPAQTDESYIFWQHVRLAGFAPGSTTIGDATFLPTNADGGPFGIQSISGAANIPTTPVGFSGAYAVCSGNVRGEFAKQLDTTLDDGQTNGGSLRVFTTGGTTWLEVLTVDDSTNYNVCMAF